MATRRTPTPTEGPPADWTRRFEHGFFARDPLDVARDLLGAVLVHDVDGQRLAGRIVETEAYLPARDPASHSARGKTPSNASMFLPGGALYVYPIHAKYCLNAVTEEPGLGCAVLILI